MDEKERIIQILVAELERQSKEHGYGVDMGVLGELSGDRVLLDGAYDLRELAAAVQAAQAEHIQQLEAALRALMYAPTDTVGDPINDREGGCVWCGGGWPGEATGDPTTHKPDCPWVRARRLLGEG